MPLQKYVRTITPKMIEVRSNNGKTYPAVLDKGVKIPTPIQEGGAEYIKALVEFEHNTPVVKGFDYLEITEEDIAFFDDLGADY